MRTIKFRAWHKFANQMLTSSYQSDVLRWEEEGQPVIIMQFTGLHDKNGKEVYEGDYVKWTFGGYYWEAIIQTVPNNKSNTLYAIETYHNCTLNEDETTYTFERSDSRKGSRNDIEYLSTNIEVLGNIYENPELL